MVDVIKIDPLPPIEVVRRKNQKRIIFRVKDNRNILSAPPYLSKKQLMSFISQNKTAISDLINNKNDYEEEISAERENNKHKCLIDGVWRDIIISDTETSLLEPVVLQETILFVHPKAMNHEQEEFLVRYFTYSFMANKVILSRFSEVQKKLPFTVKKVALRNQKKRWGSCSSKGNISLNWRLIKCPPWIQEYIFIHELCHRKEMNHSPRFWSLVEHYYPNYREAEQWLRENERFLFEDL